MKVTHRDPGRILSLLSDLPGKPVIAKSKLTIHFPARFVEIGLAVTGVHTFVFGLFIIVDESGAYSLCNVNALMELGPATVTKETMDEQEYLNYTFEAGDVIFQTKDLVCRPNLIYRALDEFIFKGKLPWYIAYDDVGKLFDTAKRHARTSANISPAIVEFVAAYIGRDPADRIKYIRETAETYNDFKKVEWVPMQSVFWSAPGTVNKLSGAYFTDGIVSALVNPSERADRIETILRA